MKQKAIILTEEDHEVLESYKGLMEGMVAYLGNGYEMVLHSLENLEHSAIKVINGKYTGRKEGAPITELALSMLERIQNDPSQKDHICYQNVNKDGHPLRSTTIAVRSRGRIIGLLCINFYMDTPLSEFLSVFHASPNQNETYVQDTEEMIHSAVQGAITAVTEMGLDDTPIRNREVVARLNDAGIFRMKDAVNCVANELGISRNTVYMHLRNLRGEN